MKQSGKALKRARIAMANGDDDVKWPGRVWKCDARRTYMLEYVESFHYIEVFAARVITQAQFVVGLRMFRDLLIIFYYYIIIIYY